MKKGPLTENRHRIRPGARYLQPREGNIISRSDDNSKGHVAHKSQPQLLPPAGIRVPTRPSISTIGPAISAAGRAKRSEDHLDPAAPMPRAAFGDRTPPQGAIDAKAQAPCNTGHRVYRARHGEAFVVGRSGYASGQKPFEARKHESGAFFAHILARYPAWHHHAATGISHRSRRRVSRHVQCLIRTVDSNGRRRACALCRLCPKGRAVFRLARCTADADGGMDRLHAFAGDRSKRRGCDRRRQIRLATGRFVPSGYSGQHK